MTRTVSADAFRGLLHRLEPDYRKPLLEVPGAVAERIRGRLESLYGAERREWVAGQVERLMKVHHAYQTDEIVEMERRFDPRERFSERDAVLITYGDLIVSENKRPLRALADFAEVFFQGLVTTLHILPFFPYSSDRGFSVVSYEEVDPRLGSWEEIEELEADFKLMFDGVFNHVSSKSYWFQQFLNGDPDFEDWFMAFTTRHPIPDSYLKLIMRPRTTPLLTEYRTIHGPRWVWTTFSADQVDLNFKNPRVLLKVLEILLYYVRRGADIVRLDAITYLWCELGTSCAHLAQTHQVVKLFRDVLDVVAPHVALITETNVPHRDNISYFGDGTDEAQMVYNFALPPLVLHTFQTGDATVLSHWAAELDPPSETTAFFNFLDSHDGIGLLGAKGILSDREILAMCGRVEEHGGFVSCRDAGGVQEPYELNITWFSALNREDAGEPRSLQVDRFIASRAVALALRGVPGIYLPSFFGTANDVEAVYRDGSRRSINRPALVERRLFEAFADPESVPSMIARRFTRLLELRTTDPAFHPSAPQEVLDLGPEVFAVLRTARGGATRTLVVVNVTGRTVEVALPEARLGAERVTDRLTGVEHAAAGGAVRLEPYQVLWLV